MEEYTPRRLYKFFKKLEKMKMKPMSEKFWPKKKKKKPMRKINVTVNMHVRPRGSCRVYLFPTYPDPNHRHSKVMKS